MPNSRPSPAAVLLLLSLACPLPADPQQAAPAPMQKPSASANEATSAPINDSPAPSMDPVQATLPPVQSPLTRDEQILQVLNRFTYGPRPGDLESIRATGLSAWFTAQLNPWRIDDSALDRRLAAYPAMQLPLAKLMELYPNGAMIRAALNGRAGVPRGEGEKAIYNAQKERYSEKRRKGDAAAEAKLSEPAPLPVSSAAILALDAPARFDLLSKLTPAQIGLLRQHLSAPERDQLVAGFTPHQAEILAAIAAPQGVVASEVVQTKLLRDIYSERQLNEVMVDFWLNHFNVYIRKSEEAPYFIASYERDTIRPRALGKFENLLVATAISPAMLNYLDNASSIGPHSDAVSPILNNRFGRRPPQNASGLNENYARELMELHTLGVNGGYTQKDVTEVARVFTGWTLGRGFDPGGPAIHPEFDRSKHEPGDKIVLGVKIKQNQQREGLQVLHLLASSPQTAHFISQQLAVRFVSDDPPPALVTRMTVAWIKSEGDIRRVLIAMIQSPEFFSRATYRAKVKTPQDYVISAVRASGADVESAGALAATLAELGMTVYGMQTPNGYSMRADPWNNTASLVSRLNFALALSTNRVFGVHTDWTPILRTPTELATPGPLPFLTPEVKDRLLEDRILHLSVSDRTRQAILAQITADPAQQRATLRQIAAKNQGRDPLSSFRVSQSAPNATFPDTDTALAAGLLFGSPEFQRR